MSQIGVLFLNSINIEPISNLVLVFLLLTLNMQLPVRRAKKTKQTLNIRAESKILRNEIKVITKPSKEMYITWIYLKKKTKRIYHQLGNLFAQLPVWAEKYNLLHTT